MRNKVKKDKIQNSYLNIKAKDIKTNKPSLEQMEKDMKEISGALERLKNL